MQGHSFMMHQRSVGEACRTHTHTRMYLEVQKKRVVLFNLIPQTRMKK